MRTHFLTFALAGLLALMPLAASAQSSGFFGPNNPIVPEECQCRNQVAPDGTSITTAPDFGCVLQVAQNVLNALFYFAIILIVIYIVFIGFQYMATAFTGNSPSKITVARTRIVNVVVGLIVILSSWLIVDFVMKNLYDKAEFGPWNKILAANDGTTRCIIARDAGPLVSGSLTIETTGDSGRDSAALGNNVENPIEGVAGCPKCVSLTGYTCKSGTSCRVDSAYKARLDALKATFSGNWAVTEAYPPTYPHKNACHRNGTCIDAGFRGSTEYTPENIAAFANAAKRADLRPVFETKSCSLRDAAMRAGVTAFCIKDRGYGHITGSHFSLYADKN